MASFKSHSKEKAGGRERGSSYFRSLHESCLVRNKIKCHHQYHSHPPDYSVRFQHLSRQAPPWVESSTSWAHTGLSIADLRPLLNLGCSKEGGESAGWRVWGPHSVSLYASRAVPGTLLLSMIIIATWTGRRPVPMTQIMKQRSERGKAFV